MFMQMGYPLPRTGAETRKEGVCLLIRNETVKETTIKKKKDSEIRKPVTPACVLFRANV